MDGDGKTRKLLCKEICNNHIGVHSGKIILCRIELDLVRKSG